MPTSITMLRITNLIPFLLLLFTVACTTFPPEERQPRKDCFFACANYFTFTGLPWNSRFHGCSEPREELLPGRMVWKKVCVCECQVDGAPGFRLHLEYHSEDSTLPHSQQSGPQSHQYTPNDDSPSLQYMEYWAEACYQP